MAMNKVLISGGAGFVGYHLARYLSKKKYSIHIVDNFSRGKFDSDFETLLNSSNIKFIKADLTNPNSYKLFDKDYDYIYHLAAIVGVKNVIENPEKVLYVNTVLILNLLEWIKRTQKNLKRMIFASTSEVYAGTARYCGISIPTGEDVSLCLEDIRSPRTTYALSKIVGECACFNYSKHNVPFTIVRYHNVYGPRMGTNHVIPELMHRAKKSKKYLGVYSVGHTRAFCYISDAIEAVIKLAQAKDSLGQIFNVGNSNEEITIKKLAEEIINVVNPTLKIKPLSDQIGSPSRRCPNVDKLKRTIKFQPKISIDEGIKLTWKWYEGQEI